jgi:Flp pilus assembly protein TadD
MGMAVSPEPRESDDPFAAAIALFEIGRLDRAEAELRRALAVDPEHPSAHGYLAICLVQRGALKEALSESDEALRLQPGRAAMWLVRSEVLRLLRRIDDALLAADEAIECDPTAAGGFLARARANLDKLGHAEEALVDVRQAIALEPNDDEAHRLQATILTNLGRSDEAAQAAATALSLDPGSADAHTVLGWQCLHAGRRDDAMSAFREALRIAPFKTSARAGLLQTMSAGNPLYAIVQRWLLWNARAIMSGRGRWLVPIFVLILAVARNGPATRPYLAPLLGVAGIWIVGLLLVRPLSNAVLHSTEEGRRLLTEDECAECRLTIGAFAGALLCVVAWPATGDPTWAVVAASMLALSMFVQLVFREAGRGRRIRAVVGAASLVVMALGLVLVFAGAAPRNGSGVPYGNVGMMLIAPIAVTLGLPLLDRDMRRARARLPRRARRRRPRPE